MVHRLYSQRDLQLDINLLTSAFPVVLADALDRALQHTVHVIPSPEQDEGCYCRAGWQRIIELFWLLPQLPKTVDYWPPTTYYAAGPVPPQDAESC